MILVFFVSFLRTFSLKHFLKSIDNVNFKLQFIIAECDVLNNFIFLIFKSFNVLIKVCLKIKLNSVLILNFLSFLFF